MSKKVGIPPVPPGFMWRSCCFSSVKTNTIILPPLLPEHARIEPGFEPDPTGGWLGTRRLDQRGI